MYVDSTLFFGEKKKPSQQIYFSLSNMKEKKLKVNLVFFNHHRLFNKLTL